MNDKSAGYRTSVLNNQSEQFQSIAAIIDLVKTGLTLLIHKRSGPSKFQGWRMFWMFPVAPCDLLAHLAIGRISRFWIKESTCTADKYPDLSKLVSLPNILWVFSNLQHIKSKNRNTLTGHSTSNKMMARTLRPRILLIFFSALPNYSNS